MSLTGQDLHQIHPSVFGDRVIAQRQDVRIHGHLYCNLLGSWEGYWGQMGCKLWRRSVIHPNRPYGQIGHESQTLKSKK
jgi:hypothetical protein